MFNLGVLSRVDGAVAAEGAQRPLLALGLDGAVAPDDFLWTHEEAVQLGCGAAGLELDQRERFRDGCRRRRGGGDLARAAAEAFERFWN